MLLNVSSSFLICNAYDMLVYAVLRSQCSPVYQGLMIEASLMYFFDHTFRYFSNIYLL